MRLNYLHDMQQKSKHIIPLSCILEPPGLRETCPIDTLTQNLFSSHGKLLRSDRLCGWQNQPIPEITPLFRFVVWFFLYAIYKVWVVWDYGGLGGWGGMPRAVLRTEETEPGVTLSSVTRTFNWTHGPPGHTPFHQAHHSPLLLKNAHSPAYLWLWNYKFNCMATGKWPLASMGKVHNPHR